MKKAILTIFAFVLTTCVLPAAFAAEKGKTGEQLFREYCAVCHPDGGNIVNKDFTLMKKDREEHGVRKAADIIGKMRDPGPGMTKFDRKTITDKDAKKIADYILKTFK